MGYIQKPLLRWVIRLMAYSCLLPDIDHYFWFLSTFWFWQFFSLFFFFFSFYQNIITAVITASSCTTRNVDPMWIIIVVTKDSLVHCTMFSSFYCMLYMEKHREDRVRYATTPLLSSMPRALLCWLSGVHGSQQCLCRLGQQQGQTENFCYSEPFILLS